ncbi:hypothetical protein M407DRAFT_29402 [Tulasnella calospora MUT 4182]|uniref:Uncharacterized protein n=1 Tax=Tulasnella calospora MUT 4182 TaxID=1051891 RepID=A0A0C3PZJ3_9AGAM|nr:hypothetical protein M407DRAFT_29402 [Tulasnella calospora MUT 4182]
MQQIKVFKPAPDPYLGAVYMEDLGPASQPPPTPSVGERPWSLNDVTLADI